MRKIRIFAIFLTNFLLFICVEWMNEWMNNFDFYSDFEGFLQKNKFKILENTYSYF